MEMIRHNDHGIDLKRPSFFDIAKSGPQEIDLFNQQVVMSTFRKIDREEPR